jgi:hypothetical protein
MSVIADEFNESGVAPPQRRPWTKNSIWRIARRTAAMFGQTPPAGKRIGTAQNKIQKRVGGDQYAPVGAKIRAGLGSAGVCYNKHRALSIYDGGGGGIRTRDTVSRIHTFQACAFSRSATPPSRALEERGRGR